ncbi:MAG: glycerol-3-phosphate dehydrogenase [Proteobacteria bacterium]|nr:glycerol-3-phosphate dehydrogenase [Pseudomonadota bacterium]
MREGSLEAPTRHKLDWTNPEFWDEAKLDAELRRVFDICHGCRRCFNLCDSFPRLFDLVDAAGAEEMHAVKSEDFAQVVDACTLCDLCYMTKCPYVPPHEFNLDFPHLMLRYRAVAERKGEVAFAERQLTETDRNGKLASLAAPIVNWAGDTSNRLTRPLLERVAKVHREAALPKFQGSTFLRRARLRPPAVDAGAPAHGRKAVLYATCFVIYNEPRIGAAAQAVLAKNGVETEVVYPGCCGMPQLEHGALSRVAGKAAHVASELGPWIDRGYDVIALIPSCALMLKFEWPLILPEDERVKKLAGATWDISEYIVDIARKEGLAPGLQALDGGIGLHIACHARAQNIGQKAADLLRLIPGAELAVVERCSGHGGSWGVMQQHFEVALKQGKPVARQIKIEAKPYLASECPLAARHILQGLERLDGAGALPESLHPIEIFAKAYGLGL